jgi:hypothetical protein
VEQQNKSTAFKVEMSPHTWVTEHADEEDDWGRDSTSSSHDFLSAKIVPMKESADVHRHNFDCVGAYEAVEGEPVFVVAAVYSTGDSFGHDERNSVEIIEAFKTEEKAERCRRQIDAHTTLYAALNTRWVPQTEQAKINEKIEALLKELPTPPNLKMKSVKGSSVYQMSFEQGYTATYQNERDELCAMSVPWIGYFETLDDLSVHKFTTELTAEQKNGAKPRKKGV